MSHNHDHNQTKIENYNSKFKIGIILNLLFVAIEFIIGLLYNSLALIADAGHNLTDVVGLVIAWVASYLTLKKPTSKFTYGFKKSPIIGAQLNSLILLVAIGVIIWEAISRLSNPPNVEGYILIVVAGIGVLINGVTTYLFHSGKDSDLNIKGAYLHMLADTLISIGVVVSGILILFTNANWIDPALSILIAVLIFWSTWKLLREATKLSLDGVPENIKIDEMKQYLTDCEEIKDYHHLHIWALSTTETALTIHIIPSKIISNENLIKKLVHDFEYDFSIHHSTIQIEEGKCVDGC